MSRSSSLTLLAALISALGLAGVIAYRADDRQAKIGFQPDGRILVTTNQVLTPYGKLVRIEGARPKDLALSADGSKVAVLCNGRVSFFTVQGDPLGEVRLATSAVGIAWSPDGDCFAAGGDGKVVRLSDLQGKWAIAETFAADTQPAGQGNPQVTGLGLLDRRNLVVALGRRNRVQRYRLNSLVTADEPTATLAGETAVEAAPYHVLIDGSLVVAANRGGKIAREQEPSADSSGTSVAIDPKTDAAARGSLSFWSPDRGDAAHIPIGRGPSGMDVHANLLAVACADDDTVWLLDKETRKQVRVVQLRRPVDDAFGAIPTDVAFDPEGKRLFVACGGLNAVAVIDLPQGRIAGYLPTAHFPIALERSGDTLIVASSKGLGNRLAGKESRFGVHDNVGTLQFVPLSDALSALPTLSAQVAENNRWSRELPARNGRAPVPVPERVGEPSVFKHVIYVIKENHTYDTDFGDIKEGNGDPSLCVFPEEVTPNAHALARQFVLLDNTYTSGTNSADGHQWTSTAVANGYTEQNYAANTRSYPYDGGDPLAFSPKGFLWTAAMAKRIGVRVYGEFVDRPVIRDPSTGKTPTFKELWDAYKAGLDRYEIQAQTSQASLRKVLHPRFIGFPSIVSDQWRVDQFLSEFRQWEKSGKMPQFLIMLFPNNHTSGTNPGMPTPRASVADNDLALGRLVEAVSRSKFWKDTLILVIEDGSQLGLDHVDGHRTIAQVISPYTRRGSVNSDMFNHTSFIRTMGLILGFPALTRFDRTATPLTSCFTATPDYTSFTAIGVKVPLDELNPPRSQLSGESLHWATESAKLNWDDVDLADAEVVARSVWHAQKPGRRFPVESFRPNPDDDD